MDTKDKCVHSLLFLSFINALFQSHPPPYTQSLQKTKQLLRAQQLEQLEAVNESECELLEERWLSDECAAAIISFMQRRKK